MRTTAPVAATIAGAEIARRALHQAIAPMAPSARMAIIAMVVASHQVTSSNSNSARPAACRISSRRRSNRHATRHRTLRSPSSRPRLQKKSPKWRVSWRSPDSRGCQSRNSSCVSCARKPRRTARSLVTASWRSSKTGSASCAVSASCRARMTFTSRSHKSGASDCGPVTVSADRCARQRTTRSFLVSCELKRSTASILRRRGGGHRSIR